MDIIATNEHSWNKEEAKSVKIETYEQVNTQVDWTFDLFSSIIYVLWNILWNTKSLYYTYDNNDKYIETFYSVT